MQSSSAGRDEGGGDVVLDRQFGADQLAGLREAVQQCAASAGLGGERAIDVMLAVHELAANVVRHGAGQGRLLVEVTAKAVHCQVSDAGADAHQGRPDAGAGGTASPAPSWPVEHGHGLWLVRRTADQVQVSHGPAGSVVYLAFARPGA